MTAILTRERLLELLQYDPMTGDFTWRRFRKSGVVAGAKAGTTSCGYVYIKIEQRRYLAHRLAWFYMTGGWPAAQIDHRDTVGTNNAWDNLRTLTNAVNQQNKRVASTRSKTGVLGVRPSASGLRFQAVITTNGVQKTMGHFGTTDEAHAAYVSAKRQLHSGNTL